MLRFSIIGLAVCSAILGTPAAPWLVETVGMPDALGTLDLVLMLLIVLFLLATVFGLVRRFGR